MTSCVMYTITGPHGHGLPFLDIFCSIFAGYIFALRMPGAINPLSVPTEFPLGGSSDLTGNQGNCGFLAPSS